MAAKETGVTTGVDYLTAGTGTTTAPSIAVPDEVQGLATVPSEVNIANAPNLETLSGIVNRINQQAQKTANLSRIPGAAELEQQSSQNISDLLGGKLSSSWLEQLQSGLAQRFGSSGFGVDTQALNAAALRSSGIEQQRLRAQGEEQLAAAYARNPAAPIWDVSQGMLTPELYTKYLNDKAMQAAEAARLSENRRQFDVSQEWARESASADAQARLQIAQMQAGQAQRELDEKVREFNATRDTNVAMQIAELRQRAQDAGLNVQLATQQLNAQVYGTSLQYMDPAFASAKAIFTKSLPQYVTTSASPGSNMINIPSFNAPQLKMIGGW